MACHHRLWAAHTVERRWAWHDITAFGQNTRSNDVERAMPTPPLASTHGRTTSSVAFHYLLWAAHTIELRRAWHAIIAFWKHKQSNHVGRGMPTSPLGSTHGRTTSGMACQHHLWEAQTVERRREWHANITFGQHTRSNNVGRSMPALPLGSTRSKDVGRGMTSPPLNSTHGRTMSSATCHHHH